MATERPIRSWLLYITEKKEREREARVKKAAIDSDSIISERRGRLSVQIG